MPLLMKGNSEQRHKRFVKYTRESGGFCWICGELNFRYLVNHHILGVSNDSLCCNLCANCHQRYYIGFNMKDIHVSSIMKAIEEGIMF